jgi:hypothetical protein
MFQPGTSHLTSRRSLHLHFSSLTFLSVREAEASSDLTSPGPRLLSQFPATAARLFYANAMAVAKKYPRLKVQVFAEGLPLEEHNDDEEQIIPDVVTKYIEASSGDNFEVHYSFSPGFSIKHDVLAEIKVDGNYADSHVFHSGLPIRWNQVYTCKGTREAEQGKFFLRKFCFSQLDTGASMIL